MAKPRPGMTEPAYFILTALLDGPLHGYGIIKRAEEQSDGRVRLAVGTLYGALDRLRERGLIVQEGEEVVDGRVRRYYRVTDEGTDAAVQEARRMQKAARLVIGRPGTVGA